MISYTGSSNAISYPLLQNTINSLSAEEIFKKGFRNSGDDGLPVSKNKSTDSSDDSQIVGSTSSSTTDIPDALKKNKSSNVSYLRAKTENTDDTTLSISYGKNKDDAEVYYDGKVSSIPNSFDALAVEIGAVNNKISKEQLVAYLQSLKSDASGADDSQAIAFVKNLIARFDTLSGGTDYITSFTGVKEAQDVSTITQEQVTLPIDLRV